jgi:hypothetical protein
VRRFLLRVAVWEEPAAGEHHPDSGRDVEDSVAGLRLEQTDGPVRLPVVHAVVATVGPLVELAGNSGGVASRQSHRSQNAFLSHAASTVEAST